MAKIAGSYSDDVLKGSEETDYIWGLPGIDTIDGGGGDDFVDGGTESDILTSSSGYDRIHGGAGDDQITLAGTGGAVTGGTGYDALVVDFPQSADRMVFNGAGGHGYVGDPNAANRHIFFHDIEWLRLFAGSGDDRIIGTDGGDRISTGAGNDVVNAGAGHDIITNTGGHDRLDGGDGTDRFVLVGTGSTVFGGPETIRWSSIFRDRLLRSCSTWRMVTASLETGRRRSGTSSSSIRMSSGLS